MLRCNLKKMHSLELRCARPTAKSDDEIVCELSRVQHDTRQRSRARAGKCLKRSDQPADDDFVAMDDPLLDLVVIGAGPHALSLLSRLVDDAPDLLSEKERVRIAHKAGSRGKSHATVRKHLQRKAYDGAEKLPRVVVIDAHGEWLAQWRADFEALDIRHTRSHSDLHPCPFDFASLRVWAEIKGRQSEMVEMDHLDRDHSRSLGYGGPFTLVGTSLFNDFCASLVDRYGLSPLVRAGKVVDVRIIPPASALPSTATDAMDQY